MAATSRALSEAEFQSRKAVLQAHRTAAEQEHNRAAYLAVVGEDGPDPEQAKQNLDLIDSQIAGLEAAWKEAQQLAAKEAKRIDARERSERLKRISGHLSARAKAVSEIDKALSALAAPVASFRESSTAIVTELKEHTREFSHFPSDVFFTVWPAPDPLQRLMAGLLFKAKVDLHNVDFTAGGFFVDERGGLAAWVKEQNGRIRSVAETIAPASGEEA